MFQGHSAVLAAYVTDAERSRQGVAWEEVARPFEYCAAQFDDVMTALPADGWFLAEFANALDALKCALDIQRGSISNTAEVSAASTPLCHVGLNIETASADYSVWPPDRDDSVCRLVALAEPGGICLSRTVYDIVRFQVVLPFETERDPNHTAYQCGEIRNKLNTLNLLEAGSVRLSASGLAALATKHTGDSPHTDRNFGLLGKISALFRSN